jgi:replicative DNA helicase
MAKEPAQSQQDRDQELASEDLRPLELTILGYLLVRPHKYYEVAELREDHFTSPSRQKLFRVIMHMARDNPDQVESLALLNSKLSDEGVGGDQATELIVQANDMATDSLAVVMEIMTKLINFGMRRATLHASEQIATLARTKDATSDELVASMGDILADTIRENTVARIGTLAEELDLEMGRLERDERPDRGLPTGFSGLDDMLGGYRGGELIVIAARPSMGKTSLLNNIIHRLAYQERVPGLVVSDEMGREDLARRAVCYASKINLQFAQRRSFSPSQANEYAKWAMRLQEAPVYIDDRGGSTVERIGALARRLVHEQGVRWLFIDYLQLMDHRIGRNEQMTQAVGRTSNGLKRLAKSLNVPVILLSQLNREPDKRDNKRPRKSDLRESGSIEQDADAIIFPFREGYYHMDDKTWDGDPGKAELILAKHRNGPVGVVDVRWHDEYGSYEDSAPSTPSQAATFGY